MRICYVPTDFSGPGMYRCILPFRELEKHGHWAKTPFYHSQGRVGSGQELFQYELDRLPDAEVYVFQQPLDIGVLGLIKTLKKAGKVVVGESDDSPHIPRWHPAFSATHRANNAARNRQIRWQCFQACDAVTVSTAALGEQYLPTGRVKVLPNRLWGAMWATTVPQFEVERERVRVGWMGSSAYRAGDLEVLRPWLKDFLVSHPGVDFVAAGSPEIHDLLGVPDQQRVSFEGVDWQHTHKITATMDVGLVPLALDGESRLFNEAKSCLKGMEYAACGIPCVASPSAEYRRWVNAATGNGFIARTSEEWVASVDKLVTDHWYRKAMGRAALRKATLNTIEDHCTEWTDFYGELVERKARTSKPTWDRRAREWVAA